MKISILLLIFVHTLLFAGTPDQRLLEYQKKYSLCKGKTDYQISSCLLNGNLNYYNFRGERNAYRHVSTRKIKQAAKQGRAYEFTMEQIPHTQRYVLLKEYLDHLYAVRKEYTPPQFKGNKEEDIIRMKRVFNLLQSANLEETAEITPEFEQEVLEYQRRHSMAVDGKIGPRTKRALKEPIYNIIVKIKKNLTWERISRTKPARYVLVNIPEFKMHYYENHEEVLSMKVVVGKPKMRTPVFNRKMQYIVLNPTWNVPDSIYRKEYAHLSPAKLKKLGLRYRSDGKLYQPAGRKNALGLVKFLFPNKYNVYMHDTPAKSRFLRTTRAYSHGCIRLEKPMDLLHKLGYSYKPGKTIWKTLDTKIPVFVEYHTVWVDEGGAVNFADDIYGYEKKMFTKPVKRVVPRKKRPVHTNAIINTF